LFEPLWVTSLSILRRSDRLRHSGELAASKTPSFGWPGPDPRNYAHLDTRKTVVSVAYLSLVKDKILTGAIEILSFENQIDEETLEALIPIAKITPAALQEPQPTKPNETNPSFR